MDAGVFKRLMRLYMYNILQTALCCVCVSGFTNIDHQLCEFTGYTWAFVGFLLLQAHPGTMQVEENYFTGGRPVWGLDQVYISPG